VSCSCKGLINTILDVKKQKGPIASAQSNLIMRLLFLNIWLVVLILIDGQLHAQPTKVKTLYGAPISIILCLSGGQLSGIGLNSHLQSSNTFIEEPFRCFFYFECIDPQLQQLFSQQYAPEQFDLLVTHRQNSLQLFVEYLDI
jgi:hypothetical protein